MNEPTSFEVIGRANDLLASHSSLMNQIRDNQRAHRRQLLDTLNSPPEELIQLPLIPSTPSSPKSSEQSEYSPPPSPIETWKPPNRSDLLPGKRARVAKYKNYIPEEETIRNDYSQHHVDSGEWPQNFVLGAEPEHRFEEYPKQQRFLALKKANVASHSLPPSYLRFSDLSSLQGCKFDAILLDPPFSSSFTWDHLQELPIPSLAADPSFIFLWVGSGAGEGLERGREILARWGYRRCEDVIWVKTNKTSNKGPGTDPPTTSLLTRSKQHCLIGIRGTVRRSTDNWFVHCNVDTDVIVWEGSASDPMLKPPEMHSLIENFCLGMRRLEIFGRALSSLRRGWVTVLSEEQHSVLSHFASPENGHVNVEGPEGGLAGRWEKDSWERGIKDLVRENTGGKMVLPMTAEIEALRPKSPTRKDSGAAGGSGGAMGHIQQQGRRNGIQQPQPQSQPQPFMNQMMPHPMGVPGGMNSLGLGMEMDPMNMMGAGNPAQAIMAMGMNPMMLGAWGLNPEQAQFGNMMMGGNGDGQRWMGDPNVGMHMPGMGMPGGEWNGQGGF